MQFNDRTLLGLTIETANQEIKHLGLFVEEYTLDPDTMFFPFNHNPKRINVRLTHEIITEIVGRG